MILIDFNWKGTVRSDFSLHEVRDFYKTSGEYFSLKSFLEKFDVRMNAV